MADGARRGIFFLVVGPAGVGKSTLLARMVAESKSLVKAVSVTTRAPRAGEVHGRSYHFWNEADFTASVAKGEFLEHAVVHGKAHYGTLARFVDEQLDAGVDVVKDIDVQGADLVRRQEAYQYPRSVSIFIAPPSWDELRRRLVGRNSESDETLNVRLQTARAEMGRIGEFDYVVVNDGLERGVAELKAIRMAEHCKRERRLVNGTVSAQVDY